MDERVKRGAQRGVEHLGGHVGRRCLRTKQHNLVKLAQRLKESVARYTWFFR